MATYGVPGSPTYAVAINSLVGMLDVLPDNSANLIDAQDVRDVVAGLYENFELISASFSSIATNSVTYTNSDPTTISVGGITFGSTFPSLTVQQIFDSLFYPYVPPSLTFSVLPSLVEYGDSSTTATLFWSVNAGKENVVSSTIFKPLDPIESVSTPTSFSLASGSSGLNTLVLNDVSIFTFSVNDGNVYSTTTSVVPSLRRFWGTIGVGSDLVTVTSSTFSYSDVSALSSELSEGYTQSREIGTNNNYVVFVWPSNSVSLLTFPPKAYINGLPNTDWTKTRDNVLFTNQFGYTASYDVWRFNNVQGTFTSSYTIII